MPAALALVAVVENAGVPLTTLLVSPETKPVIVAVKAGSAAPTARLLASAVTVRAALFTVSETVPVAGL